MKVGLFLMPSHPPERGFYDGQQWDLQVLRWADQLGYSEAWVGEHHTAPWEPNPSPDLLITQALLQTTHIRLAPGGFLLPYHHPAELANRVAFLDHLAQGRLMFGVAASGLPADWHLFNVDGASGQNRDMTREALELILRLWQEPGPWEFHGRFWTVNKPETMYRTLKYHLTPFQKPHPPIGIAGLSPGSETLKTAGEKGFYPMSLNISPGYVASHWQAVEEGARRTGRIPNRADWRLVREIFVAETDAEARQWALEGMLGRVMREYLLPLFADFQFMPYFKHDPAVADSDVTPEYLVDHGWLVGSVDTVVEKLEQMYAEVGGFGTLLHYVVDYADTPGPWQQSMELLMTQVLPRVQHLTPEPVAAPA